MPNGATREQLVLSGEESGAESAGDVEVSVLDWGGDGPLAFLAHANGFCAALWAPVAERLRRRFRVVAMDAPGHGESPHPGDLDVLRWDRLAAIHGAAARRTAAACGAERIALGVGHSFGGTLTFASSASDSAAEPLFERIALLDPVIIPPEAIAPGRPAGRGGVLAERAAKRRGEWPSRREARAFFVEKELFAAWDARCLDLYVDEALRERADGSVELKCPGEIEAAVFRSSGVLDPIGLAPRQRSRTLVVRAGRGDFPEAVHQRLVDATPSAGLEELDAGHLIPMEIPDVVGERLLAFAGEA